MRVVIVGAGLSGLSLAAFLRRINIECVILEQAPYLNHDYQLPVSLYANALSCFKAYGVDTFFESGIYEPEESFGIKDSQGKWLLQIANRHVHIKALAEDDLPPSSTAPVGSWNSVSMRAEAEAMRVEMGHVPLRATFSMNHVKKGLRQCAPEIRFGARVVDLAPHDGIKGGVHVIMEDGTAEWGDVVVGADGMHSTIRKMLYPDEVVGFSGASLGLTQIDGFTDHVSKSESGDSNNTVLEEVPCELWGLQKTLGYFPLLHHGETRMAFSATIYNEPLGDLAHSNLNEMNEEEVREMYRQALVHRFKEFGPEVTALLKNAQVAVPTEVLEVPIMAQWFNRRAVLTGEAAHGSIPSFLGQDASLCVEDASILAAALSDIPLHNDKGFAFAFRQYESVRRDRIERYIRMSRKARKFTATEHTTLRNGVLKACPGFVALQMQHFLLQWRFSATQLHIDRQSKRGMFDMRST